MPRFRLYQAFGGVLLFFTATWSIAIAPASPQPLARVLENKTVSISLLYVWEVCLRSVGKHQLCSTASNKVYTQIYFLDDNVFWFTEPGTNGSGHGVVLPSTGGEGDYRDSEHGIDGRYVAKLKVYNNAFRFTGKSTLSDGSLLEASYHVSVGPDSSCNAKLENFRVKHGPNKAETVKKTFVICRILNGR